MNTLCPAEICYRDPPPHTHTQPHQLQFLTPPSCTWLVITYAPLFDPHHSPYCTFGSLLWVSIIWVTALEVPPPEPYLINMHEWAGPETQFGCATIFGIIFLLIFFSGHNTTHVLTEFWLFQVDTVTLGNPPRNMLFQCHTRDSHVVSFEAVIRPGKSDQVNKGWALTWYKVNMGYSNMEYQRSDSKSALTIVFLYI